MRFIALLVFFTARTFGQDIEITVRVVEKGTNRPIKNAHAVIAGTTKGATTNALGFCKLKLIPQERKLVISHVTYRTEPITVPEGVPSFSVPLEKMIYGLGEIYLTAFPVSFGSTDLVPKKEEHKPRTDSLSVVELLADFPYQGGVKTFITLFGNEFQFPERELLEKAEGRTIFGFTVDKNGEYKNVGCLTDTSSNLCYEFERIISQMPKWKPGRQRGEPMEQTFSMIINYGMNDYWKRKIKELKKGPK